MRGLSTHPFESDIPSAPLVQASVVGSQSNGDIFMSRSRPGAAFVICTGSAVALLAGWRESYLEHMERAVTQIATGHYTPYK